MVLTASIEHDGFNTFRAIVGYCGIVAVLWRDERESLGR
jgi:hypothetical protein